MDDKQTPEKAIQKGDYWLAIALIKDETDKVANNLSSAQLVTLNYVIQTISEQALNQLSVADPTDYETKIDSYSLLLALQKNFANQIYSKNINTFDQTYTQDVLRYAIAKNSYEFAESITPIKAVDYQQQAKLYHQSYQNDKYLDSQAKYTKAQNTYYKMAADEYYIMATNYVSQGELKQAADFYRKASEVYAPLGKYKDSAYKAEVYYEKYYTNEAERIYQQAQQIEKTATTKVEYRRIASLYQQVIDLYKPYGVYKKSVSLAETYKKKGQIHIYIVDNQQNSSYINNGYDNDIASTLKQSYVTFVNNAAQADVVIDISIRDFYRENPYRNNVEAMSEYVQVDSQKLTLQDGTIKEEPLYKQYYFNLNSKERSNEVVIEAKVKVSGDYRYSREYNEKTESKYTEYWYTGDVPKKYKNYNQGEFLSQDKLEKKAYEVVNKNIKNDLQAIKRSLELI